MKTPGDMETHKSGATRENKAGKGRPDLISPVALWKLAQWMEQGGIHHGDRNWEKGLPRSSFKAAAFRHLLAWLDGMDDEDHASAILFNVMGDTHTKHRIDAGELPKELDDVPAEKNLRTLRNLLTPPPANAKVQCPSCGGEAYKMCASGMCYECTSQAVRHRETYDSLS